MATKEKNNLVFYEQLRNVPREAQKQFNNGRFSGTDINPMWRIKRMTEVFGACGIGWYYEVVHRSLEHSSDSTISAFIGINLYIKTDGEWSKPIYGEGGNNFASINKYDKVLTSDEAYKMALTDAFSNATKQLGLGADVWFANDKSHSTKYDQQQEVNQSATKQAEDRLTIALTELAVVGSREQLNTLWKKYHDLQANNTFAAKVKELSAKFPK